MEVEVIPVKVKPETVKKLQADVIALTQESGKKQKTIDKLKSDLVAQQQVVTTLTERVEILEGTVKP